ncbi:hypothetical protein K435DRAFT_623556, partial [Dendrothele bispora CBS 962.96]
MFRVLWDAAFEAGRQVGISDGRGEVRAESIEEGKRLGVAIAKNEAERAKTKKTDVSIDTSDLDSPRMFTLTSIQNFRHPHPFSPTPPFVLDWAEDASSLPNATLFPVPSQPPRDFTILRSQGPYTHPFQTLHQR